MKNRADFDLPDVKWLECPATLEDVKVIQERSRILLETGVEFGESNPQQVPWLVGDTPFFLNTELKERIERLGQAAFRFIDVIQQLYAEGHETVRDYLDINVPPDLRGLQIEQPILTFRTDIVVERGLPKIAEIEEVYGNIGKMHAMQKAYGTNYDALFRHIFNLGVSSIFLDNTYILAIPELRLLQRRLAESFDVDIPMAFFSEFPKNQRGIIWRFCNTKDFIQYSFEQRKKIIEAPCSFVNPLFHGYGTKLMIALAFHSAVTGELRSRLGNECFSIIQNGFPHCQLLDDEPTEGFIQELISNSKNKVLKIVDCPGGLQYTWGSHGVFLGDRSATRWRKMVEAAVKRQIFNDPRYKNVRYIISDLVESDRFDIRFLHPKTNMIALMPNARVRLGSIFFRQGREAHLVAGHATFVNTSRRVHLGHHAVCCPLDWARQ